MCPDYLRKYGWPLDEGMQSAIRDEYRQSGIVMGVQRRLGAFYLARREAGDKTQLPWREFRDLVWTFAAEAADEADCAGGFIRTP